jgi:DNA/RNA endonuclease YhcR with UshA esterase domain
VVVDIQGNIKVMGRKGEEKVKIKGKVPKSKMNDFVILKGKTFEKSAVVNTDNSGTMHILYFDGTSQKIAFKSCDANHRWFLFDVNHDGAEDVVYLDNNTIEAYQMNKSELFTLETGDAEVRNKLYFDMLPKETFRMGFADYGKNKLFLSDNTGTIIDGFPIDASSPYLIEDIDGDGSSEIIVGDNLGNIYFYPLQ